MQPPGSCKRKCIEKISTEVRKAIYTQYCSLNKTLQKEYLFQRVQSFPKERSRTRGGPKKKRSNSRIYTFKVQGEDIPVCRKFFVGKLGYKRDNVISTLSNKQSPAKSWLSPSNFPDTRCRHVPIHKMKESTKQSIIDHIGSYHPSVSHFRRKHAPLRRYLPSGMAAAEMHSDYKEKHPDETVCYESYWKIFVSMKISFTVLGEEECEKCEEYKQHDCPLSGHEPETKIDSENTCEVCKEQENHLERARKSREVYRKDASLNTNFDETYFLMNMQKVLMLPYLPSIKTALLTRRIIMIIQSIVPLGSFKSTNGAQNNKKKPKGYLWHEAI